MTPTPRSKSESKRLAITGKEGQIKKPAIGMDGDSQPARSGGGEAILSQEGPPTLRECEADDKAWEEILNRLKWEKEDEAKEIFLIRCSESAIDAVLDLEKEQKEALELDEKRRAAEEAVIKEAMEDHVHSDNCDGAGRMPLYCVFAKLDTLTYQGGDGLSWEKNQPDGLKED